MQVEKNLNSNPREVIARALDAWIRTRSFPDRLIAGVDRNRAFVMEVTYGVVRQYARLNWVLDRLRNKNAVHQLRAPILAALYQLLCMEHAETYAVVNETVKLVKSRWGQKAANFTNAVLRRADRERAGLLEELARQPMHVRESHPKPLLEQWSNHFHEQEVEALCRWNNERPPVVIHVLESRTSQELFVSGAAGKGIDLKPYSDRFPDYLIVPRGIAVTEIPGYGEGHFTVQDPSTRAAVDLLAVEPGLQIWDACAAPGGKSMLIADRMKGQGTLLASDREADRVQRLRENLERVAQANVSVREADVLDPPADIGTQYDRLLLDVPCSNTGVIRRRPDARWTFSSEKLRQLTRLQEKLLDAASCHLGHGGILVYSTCSLEPEENERLVEAWLVKHGAFTRGEEAHRSPLKTGTDGSYSVQLIKA